MKKCMLAIACLLSLFCQPFFASADNYALPSKIEDGNILHCFSWPIKDIKAELPNIAASGFGAIQISPMQRPDINEGWTWYTIYLPYDYGVFSSPGMGSREDLRDLCSEADKYGIKIIVDVVLNHVNRTDPYYNPWFNVEGRWRQWGGGDSNINYKDRYSITHDRLGDYVELNTENSDVINRAKAFIEDLKSLGVKGIRYDAAKHIELPSELSKGCTTQGVWPVVTGVTDLFHYGEVVGDCQEGDDSKISEYSKYLWVPNNVYTTQAARENGGIPQAHEGDRASKTNSHLIYWAESHDDYSNDEWSHLINQGVMDRAYCAFACRNIPAALYFSRPRARGKDKIKIEKGSLSFMGKHIVEVNKFRNAMTGKAEWYEKIGDNGCSITRQNGGAVIIVKEGTTYVEAPNGGGYCPSGTYKDRVTGNTFTVNSSTIKGNVGPSGVAVLYNDYKETPAPSKVTITGSKQYNLAYAGNFTNGDNYIHYWNTINRDDNNTNTQWPGVKMERAKGDDGKYYWCYSVPAGVTNIIFNNGASFKDGGIQTGDLPFISDYIMDNGGATITPVGFTTGSFSPEQNPSPLDKTVTIEGDYNIAYSGQFNYIHYWGGSSESDWPGVKMTEVTGDDGQTYKCFNVPSDTKNVIFTNGEKDNSKNQKTHDLTYSNHKIMCESGPSEVNVIFSDAPLSDVRVYVDGWSTDKHVYCYLYTQDETKKNGEWPGVSMRVDSESGYWYYQVPAGLENALVIVSNGTDQYPGTNQRGLELEGVSKILHINGYKWNNYPDNETPDPTPGDGEAAEPEALPVVRPSKTHCYFYNTVGWTPYIWAWNDNDNNCTSAPSWPGEKMINVEGDLWRWELPANKTTPTKIKFTNNGEYETSEYNFKSGAIYETSGEVNMPDKLYMLGNFSGNNWDPTSTSVVLNTIGDGVYIAYGVKLPDSDNDCYFNLADALGTTSGWDDNNTGINYRANRFGAPSENKQISVNNPTQIKKYPKGDAAKGTQSWKIAHGTYDIIIDLKNLTLTLLNPQSAANVESSQVVEIQKETAGTPIKDYDYLTYPPPTSGKATAIKINGNTVTAAEINISEDIYHNSSDVLFTEKALVTTSFTGTSSYNLEPQTASLGTKQSDGRFRQIVSLDNLEENKIGSKVNYYYVEKKKVDVNDTFDVKIPMQSPAGQTSVKLTVPEPKLLHSGLDLNRGGHPIKFTYEGAEFDAYYSVVTKNVEIDEPNMTRELENLAGNIFRVKVDGDYLSQFEQEVVSPDYFLSNQYEAPSVELVTFKNDVNTSNRWDANLNDNTTYSVSMTYDKPKVHSCKVLEFYAGPENNEEGQPFYDTTVFSIDVTSTDNSISLSNSGNDEIKSLPLSHSENGDWYLVEFLDENNNKLVSTVVEGKNGEQRFQVTRNCGPWSWDNYKEVIYNRWYTHVKEVRVSMLYPFATAGNAASASDSRQRVQGSVTTSSIVESEADNVPLTIGNVVTGIDNLIINESGDVIYFNIQGVQVNQPETPGIYIVRYPDGTTRKIVVD